jgi:hypothetical protein
MTTNLEEIKEFVLKSVSNITCFLVLALKRVTWNNELESTYDVHKYAIYNFFEFFKSQGLVLFKPLSEVDNILFYAVMTQNTKTFYDKRDSIRVFTLSPEGEDLIKNISEEIFRISNSRTDIKILIDEILKKTKIHRELIAENIKKEKSPQLIKNIMPDGTLFYVQSKKSKEFEIETKNILAELKILKLQNKEAQGLLTEKQKNELTLLSSNPLSLYSQNTKVSKTGYNGMYSDLSTEDLNKIMLGVTKEEERFAQEEFKKSKIKQLDELWSLTHDKEGKAYPKFCLNEKGLKEFAQESRTELKNKKNIDSGLDFLNSLN